MIIVFLQRMLKEKLPIFLINTCLLHIPLVALINRRNDRRRNELILVGLGTSLIGIYLREREIYSILHTIIPGSKPSLANKLLDMFGVNHGTKQLWPLPWPTMLVHPE
jgi:hypothetical protein